MAHISPVKRDSGGPQRIFRRKALLRGVVTVEMLLAFGPVLMTFLGVTQVALLLFGKMVVTQAASRAVRSAIVILDDAPEYYGGAPRGDLTLGDLPEEGSLTELWVEANAAYSSLLGDPPTQGGARLQAIREVAYHPLATLAPASLVGAEGSLKEELGGPVLGTEDDEVRLPELRLGVFSLAYSRVAAAVTVHTDPEAPSVSEVAHDDLVTVRVSYLMKCGVPLASALICDSGKDLAQAALGLDTSKERAKTIAALSQVASPMLRDAMLASGGHYQLLTAEASLPNQAAEYHEDK